MSYIPLDPWKSSAKRPANLDGKTQGVGTFRRITSRFRHLVKKTPTKKTSASKSGAPLVYFETWFSLCVMCFRVYSFCLLHGGGFGSLHFLCWYDGTLYCICWYMKFTEISFLKFEVKVTGITSTFVQGSSRFYHQRFFCFSRIVG